LAWCTSSWTQTGAASNLGRFTLPVTTEYDTADRATNPGYTYDPLGRTLIVPATDLTTGSAGDLSARYHDNDMAANLTQADTTKTFTLDPNRRFRAATDQDTTDPANPTETRRLVNHYTDDGDSPAWTTESTDGGTAWTWTRNILGPTGDLTAQQDSAGTVQLQLANPHGDIIATTSNTTTATGTGTYFEQTEYGTPREANTTNPQRYGWLGAKQRSTDAPAGIILMGVRLYNPTTGRFLTIDPVTGGNENAYDYPTDPIAGLDLDGRMRLPMGGGHRKYYANSGKGLYGPCPRGRYSCPQVWMAGLGANGATNRLFGPGNHRASEGMDNAFMHALWSGLMTLTMGSKQAKRFGRAAERRRGNLWRSAQMDLYNDRVGRRVARRVSSRYPVHVRAWKLQVALFRMARRGNLVHLT
jgi:RHS repeat-associated protein